MSILEQIKQTDKKYIIGVDETGWGSLAGDIFVCAFLAPKDWFINGLDDSKKLTEKKRLAMCDELEPLFFQDGFGFCISNIHPNDVGDYKKYGDNVHGALKYLYWKSVNRVLQIKKVDALIVLDGNIRFPEYPHKLGEAISLPKADALVPQVSAASILCKSYRDSYITYIGKEYPQYNWAKNKGYPSKEHFAALNKYGYCGEHRVMYEPIKSMIKNEKPSTK